jgi:dTDP-glucose pyrophosphorylase
MQRNKLEKNTVLVVLCLAGLGQRFLDGGYKTPKFLLLNNDKETTILELIITNFVLSGNDEFLLMLNKKHKKWKKTILNIERKLNVNFHLHFVSDTRGQAETAYIATQILKENFSNDEISNNPIAFHNGDTILIKRNFNTIKKIIRNNVNGVVDTFNSNSKNFSYVSLDHEGLVKEIIEKKVISNRATSGLYVFSNYDTYRTFYKKIDFSKKELFISDVYTQVLNSNLKVFNLHNENPSDTIVLGTPSEYEDWINK